MRLAVLGAGAWGSAFAISMAGRHDACLWSRHPGHVDAMLRERANTRYLPGVALPENLRLTADPEAALSGCELAVVAVPLAGLRATLMQVGRLRPGLPVLYLCKGFESGTGQFPHEVAEAALGPGTPAAVLSGPSFAADVARGAPAAVTLAARDGAFAARLSAALHGGRLRIYSTDDLTGVEVAGAVKNVVAIAAGISDGLGLGDSARAALVTRGLAEITRLGMRLGGRMETFLGLAGAGDLILTCTGGLSRNRRVGLGLAGGASLAAVLAGLGHVAEGVSTAPEVCRVAERAGADMPIVQAVAQVLDGSLRPDAAVEMLLSREPRPEHRA